MDQQKPKLKKGDRKFERGIWWTCTDPDIERWVGQGPLEPDYDAQVMVPGNRMTVAQLIAAQHAKIPTEAEIEAFCERVNARSQEYEEEAARREVTTEMLNRTYSL